MDAPLADDAAVVTGASRGIGRAIAEALAAAGADVAICSRARDRVAPVAEAITDATDRDAIAVECDVTDAEAVDRLVDRTVDRFGGVDVLVNNAGGSSGEDAPLHRVDEDSWDWHVDVNLKGPFLCTRAVLPHMVDDGGGRIVHVGSVNGLTGIGLTPYSAAKSGLLALSRNVAVRYGHAGVRSNVLSPGTVVTATRREEMDETEERAGDADAARRRWLDQYPLGRFGEPEEVAEAALFLASNRSSFVTGHNLVLDGGLTAGLDQAFQREIYGVGAD
jgi:3-oxoacyl-[acyl-carrier protein] reductase